jgi:hypothetical protein
VAALALVTVPFTVLTRAAPLPRTAQAHPTISRTVALDFQGYRFGVPPAELRFDPAGTGSFNRPTWRVFTDPTAPSPPSALVQSPAERDPAGYPLAVLRGVYARDVDASVGLKPMGGAQSAAGLAWRVRGHSAFYAAIADARTRRLDLIAVTAGRLTVLASAPITIAIEFERSTPSPSHGWFALRVRTSGPHIDIWFDAGTPGDQAGAPVIECTDPTITGAGDVALLTRHDSVAAFDNLFVRYDETPE